MKHLLTAILIMIATAGYSQTIIQDKQGNFLQIKDSTKEADTIPTGKTFTTTEREVYPVYISKNGKLYVMRVSKRTGNKYKQYLKL